MLDVSDIIETLSVELLGVVPDDKGITVSTNKGEPIVLDDTGISRTSIYEYCKKNNRKSTTFRFKHRWWRFFAALKRIFKR